MSNYESVHVFYFYVQVFLSFCIQNQARLDRLRLPMLRLCYKALLVCCFSFCHYAFSLEEYQVEKLRSIEVPWNWKTIGGFENHGIADLEQTADGAIWLALANGLARYDGTEWQYFTHHDLNKQNIIAIHQTRRGDLYIRSNSALYHYANDNWKVIYKSPVEGTYSVSKLAITESEDGSIWLAEQTGLIQVSDDKTIKHELDGIVIDDMLLDKHSNLWLVEQKTGSLFRYPVRESILQVDAVQHIPYPGEHDNSDRVHTFSIASHANCIWHASQLKKNPLYCYQVNKQRWEKVVPPHDQNQIHYGINVDSHNNIWLWGPFYITIFDGKDWQQYAAPEFAIPEPPYKIKHTELGYTWLYGYYNELLRIGKYSERWGHAFRSIKFQVEYPEKFRWFISDKNEIVVNNINDMSWHKFDPQDNLIELPKTIHISAKHDLIWVAGRHDDVAAISVAQASKILKAVLKPRTKKPSPKVQPTGPPNTTSDPPRPNPPSSSKLWKTYKFPDLGVGISSRSLTVLPDGSVLAGAHLSYQGGLVRIYPAINFSDEYQIERILPPYVPQRITTITVDKNEDLWLSSSNELFLQNLANLNKKPMSIYQQAPKDINKSRVMQVLVDNDNNKWVATRRFGLFKFDNTNWQFHNYKLGLSSRAIFRLSLLTDNTIIATSDNDVHRYDGSSWSRVFTDFVSIDRNNLELRQGLDGKIWFNTDHKNLVNSTFQLPHLREQAYKTHFQSQLFTQKYNFDENPPNTYIDAFNRTTQDGDYNIIQWSASDSWSDHSTAVFQFSYKLNDNQWSPFSYNNTHIFENLKPGLHRVSVRARDADFNIDATPAKVEFEVIPPLWLQTWFQLSLAAIFLLAIFIIFIFFRIRERHALNMQNLRSSFYTNISHELKTPLTLVLAPAEKLIEADIPEDDRKLAVLIKRNAQRLLNLVDQLLDHKKVEAGVIRQNMRDGDIIRLTNEQISSFSLFAETKNIDIEFKSSEEKLLVKFDSDIYLKILSNLVMNSVKYTPDNGSITICLHIEQTKKTDKVILILQVEDTGPGIDANEVENIFEQFYRVNDQQNQTDGSGLGLALTKELVTLCKGEIKVESPTNRENGSGTRFTVTLPLSPSNLNAETEGQAANNTTSQLVFNPSKPKILIVEDDSEISEFIRTELAPHYQVAAAENGHDGFVKAESIMPDLVITDLMMPIMNGIELCKRMKNHELLSHIPVIILTAKTSDHAELKGLSSGADDFISKPFQINILLRRIDNLVQSRKKLREKFQAGHETKTRDAAPTKKDEDFLQRALSVIHEHIDDLNFSVNDFADSMHLSYQNAYLKTKALTNMGPQDLIRSVRLEKAMQLLKSSTTKPSITDIAGRVGFDNYSYFSRSFKQKFGVPPSKVWENTHSE